jgi:hypothetical protein
MALICDVLLGTAEESLFIDQYFLDTEVSQVRATFKST